jgi:DNA-binding transcriptional ArsR family regulator
MSSRRLNPQLRRVAPIFAALGDDLRLYLVVRLRTGGPLSIARLAENMPVTRQAVTKHLRVLEDAGVVASRRSGREQLWQVRAVALNEARTALDAIGEQWEEALGSLKAFVEGRHGIG